MFASLIPSGWTLSEALGIDNNGNIVGYMTKTLERRRHQWFPHHGQCAGTVEPAVGCCWARGPVGLRLAEAEVDA